ncbi:carbohydrate ABC transporter permease [Eubacteriales bacterium OttesenSCG-928-N13]|nr:carbohydrate ABC transporter permease [Eubacteriales bacterium OttesenSCG-928-N13]
MIKNTLLTILVALPLNIVAVTLAGFAIGRMVVGKGRMQSAFLKYFIAGIILPSYVMLFPIYMISVKTGTYDTLWGVILPSIASGASLGVMLLSTAFKGIPRELDEAALIDGCGFYRMLLHILIPVVRPAIATVAIINFLGIWNNFALARVLLNREDVRVISLAAMYFKGEYSTDYALTMAGTMVLIIPQIIVFLFFQQYIVDGITSGAVKG